MADDEFQSTFGVGGSENSGTIVRQETEQVPQEEMAETAKSDELGAYPSTVPAEVFEEFKGEEGKGGAQEEFQEKYGTNSDFQLMSQTGKEEVFETPDSPGTKDTDPWDSVPEQRERPPFERYDTTSALQEVFKSDPANEFNPDAAQLDIYDDAAQAENKNKDLSGIVYGTHSYSYMTPEETKPAEETQQAAETANGQGDGEKAAEQGKENGDAQGEEKVNKNVKDQQPGQMCCVVL